MGCCKHDHHGHCHHEEPACAPPEEQDGCCKGHGHGHGHIHADTGQSRLLLAFCLTAGFMLVEAFAGFLSGSLALLADSGHMLTDAASLGIAWGAAHFGKKSADHARSFGYRRLEVLAAWINGISLIAIVALIVREAVLRLMHPVPIGAGMMLGVAVIGLAVNLACFRILHAGASTINIRAALLHVAGDILGSIAAIIAAAVISMTGFAAIDPLLSLLVAGLIAWSAWDILKRTTHVLMEGTPEGFSPDTITKRLAEGIPGVVDVHHIHAWAITPETPILTLHLRLCEGSDTEAVLASAKEILHREFGFSHTVIQPEYTDCPDRACVADSR